MKKVFLKYLLWFSLVLLICVFCFRMFLFGAILEQKLEQLSNKIRLDTSEVLVISNESNDNSELLLENLPPDIRSEIRSVLTLIKLYVGPESRIYLQVGENKLLKEYDIQVNSPPIAMYTSKKWKNSLIHFGNIDLIFINDKSKIEELSSKCGCSEFWGKILNKGS